MLRLLLLKWTKLSHVGASSSSRQSLCGDFSFYMATRTPMSQHVFAESSFIGLPMCHVLSLTASETKSHSWLILPPHHHNLRHLRAAPRRRHERAAAGPPGPRAARRPPLSRSLGPHMARERTHRRRRGARVPSHRVAHTPPHPAPHERTKVRTGRSRPGVRHGRGAAVTTPN